MNVCRSWNLTLIKLNFILLCSNVNFLFLEMWRQATTRTKEILGGPSDNLIRGFTKHFSESIWY